MVVCAVKYVTRTWFIRNNIHRYHIVRFCVRDVNECRNLCLNIKERMYFNASFVLTELSPLKDTQTKWDSGWVERVDIAILLEDIIYPQLASLCHHVECKVLKDAIVSLLIGLGQITTSYSLAHTKVVTLWLMSLKCSY